MQTSDSEAQDPIELNARRLLAIMVEHNRNDYSNAELQQLSGIENGQDVNDGLERLEENGAVEIEWIQGLGSPVAGGNVTLKARGKSIHQGFGTKQESVLPGVTHNYHLNAANSRVNISSTDNSYNIVNTTNEAVFAELKAVLMRVENVVEREQLVTAIDEMQTSHVSGGFREKYQAFIEKGANHMTLIGPFIPALTKLLGY